MAIDTGSSKFARKRVFYPVQRLNSFNVDLLMTASQAAGDALQHKTGVLGTTAAVGNQQMTGATAATDKNARLRAIGNGNPRVVPVSSLNVNGLLLTTAADGIEFCEPIPTDLDVTKPVGVNAVWTSEAAAVGARTITFTALYKTIADQVALATAATALDTVIAAQAPKGTSLAVQRGNRGVIAASKIGKTDFLWIWKVTMSAFDASFTENKYLLGLEVDYMPRPLYGRRQRRDRVISGLEDQKG